MLSRQCLHRVVNTTLQRVAPVSLVHRRLNGSLSFSKYPFLSDLKLSAENPGVYAGGNWSGSGGVRTSVNPANGEKIAYITEADAGDYSKAVLALDHAKESWASVPMPLRGEIVRQIGEELRANKDALGRLVSLEMGKILSEGLGEVQEAIDICDFATGLSRTIGGSILPSERPGHFMMERWNPLKGHVGIITAFNFPCAVFFWNAALSLVCGNTQIFKGAESTSLVAIACTKIVETVLKRNGHAGVHALVQGPGKTVGEQMINDKRIELVSFTGSTHIGQHVGHAVSKRWGKHILELGGNNAMIVMDDADLKMAKRAALFSAVGTAGQRCTSLRRIYLQERIYDEFVASLITSYKSIKVGDPMDKATLCGPLHTASAVDAFARGVEAVKNQKGSILFGGSVISSTSTGGAGNFVTPTIAAVPTDAACVQDELFVPIVYVMKFKTLEEAIVLNNSVSQGLSSCLFTTNQASVFKWTGEHGSDCGIVNVNIGPSGAEIGGAFGGEKATGGGRESGSDSWKQYMRRSTCTINHSKNLPLAQGVSFGDE